MVNEMLFIRSGYVKSLSTHDDGSQRIIWIAGRYDIVPSETFFSSRPKTQYEYIALSAGSGYRVEKKYFHDETKDNIAVQGQIANAFSDHYDLLLEHIDAINQPTVRLKIANALYSLTARFSSETECDIYRLGIELTHQDIADLVGATRESVSLELKQLMNERRINYTRSKFIIDTEKLREIIHK